MLANKRQIWSAQACKIIASDLEKQAQKWRQRAREIENFRGNIPPVQDPAPAMKAALRVLTSVQNGMDPIQECKMVCRALYLDFDAVWMLYGHKKAAWDRDQRAKRNRAMIKMSLSGSKNLDIARRFDISPAQVSRIVNAPIRPSKYQ